MKRLALGLIAVALLSGPAPARDPDGRWAQLQPGETVEEMQARSAWFARQKMPDSPRQSCCGEADAYYADSVRVDSDGTVWAVITDERPDAPLGRPHIKVGTTIIVPPAKNKDTRADPNPTGHTIIFVRWYEEESPHGNWGVLCYLPNGSM
jgi:hypothetical protein